MAPVDKFNIFWRGVVGLIFIALASFNFLNQGRSSSFGFNPTALTFFGYGALIGIVLVGYFITMERVRRVALKGGAEVFTVGHISESMKGLIFSGSIKSKLIVHSLWLFVVLLVVTTTGLNIWGQPDILTDEAEFKISGSGEFAVDRLGAGGTILYVGIMPGFTEDIVTFGLSAVFVTTILLLIKIFDLIFKIGIKVLSRLVLTIAIIIACPLASSGIGFVPGFASAHENVGGQNLLFLATAFVFQTANLYVMWFTGTFLPIAHIVHNSVLALGFTIEDINSG